MTLNNKASRLAAACRYGERWTDQYSICHVAVEVEDILRAKDSVVSMGGKLCKGVIDKGSGRESKILITL